MQATETPSSHLLNSNEDEGDKPLDLVVNQERP